MLTNSLINLFAKLFSHHVSKHLFSISEVKYDVTLLNFYEGTITFLNILIHDVFYLAHPLKMLTINFYELLPFELVLMKGVEPVEKTVLC